MRLITHAALRGALGAAAGLAALSGCGCAGTNQAGTPAEDAKAPVAASTPPVADEQGLTKAAKDLAQLYAKLGARAQEGKASNVPAARLDRPTRTESSGAGSAPTMGAGLVTVRDPATAGAASAPASSQVSGASLADAAPAALPAIGRGDANAPASLQDDAGSAMRGRTAEAAQVVRTKQITEYTQRLATLLEQDAAASQAGTGTRSAGDGKQFASPVVSAAMVLAALAPVDVVAADRFAAIRGRLDDEQLHTAETVRRIVEVARGGEPKLLASGGADDKPSGAVPALPARVGVAASGAEAGALSRVIVESAAKLDEQRGLRLGTIALASAVESFGRYTPMDTTRFTAGRRTPVLVYAELGNFSNGAGEAVGGDSTEGAFTVMLRQSVQLLREIDGTVAEDYGPQEFSSKARASRRDLFLARRIELPANLSIGKYVLNVHVRDMATGAETESKLKLEVGAR